MKQQSMPCKTMGRKLKDMLIVFFDIKVITVNQHYLKCSWNFWWIIQLDVWSLTYQVKI